MVGRAAVRLSRLVFAWPGQERAVIRISSFSLAPGEQVFLSGPSGSGKSTLLALIGGILRPRSGSVTVNGVCLHSLGGWARDAFRGDEIGFIFQQFNLIPYLSILENVLIPCHFSRKRRLRAKEAAGSPLRAAHRLLERLDLAPDLWNRQVTRLSVGQQQRVAAARALMGGPSLLIADEPTSSLDADRREGFLRLLLRECREAGAGLLFVSHDRSLAEAFPVRLEFTEINEAATG
ncbi:MAG: ABC transporter ATP-binding protein [Desulfovibrio sp.]|jgi:putative ABC transport system ATP-binding protein|nr:ABC transporter ATP-binding protein [Desulfovibrio sp.]